MDYMKRVIAEITEVTELIEKDEINMVAEELIAAKRILVVAVGRVLIALKAWVKRFHHLGVDINFVGSETEGAVIPGDVLLVASSSGESAVPKAIAEIAKSKSVKVIYIGSNKASSIGVLSDISLKIPCKTKLGLAGEYNSFQPMSTLFEQVLFLLGDVIAYQIMDKITVDEAIVISNHANLE